MHRDRLQLGTWLRCVIRDRIFWSTCVSRRCRWCRSRREFHSQATRHWDCQLACVDVDIRASEILHNNKQQTTNNQQPTTNNLIGGIFSVPVGCPGNVINCLSVVLPMTDWVLARITFLVWQSFSVVLMDNFECAKAAAEICFGSSGSVSKAFEEMSKMGP